MKAIIFDLDQTLVDSMHLKPLRNRGHWSQVYNRIPELSPYPGIDELLTYLNENGIRAALVTTSPKTYVQKILDQFNWTFAPLVCYHDTTTHKPSPEPIQKAIEDMELCPEDCWAIGDESVDILAAKALGVYSIAALWGSINHAAVLSASPDLCVNSVDEFISIIRRQLANDVPAEGDKEVGEAGEGVLEPTVEHARASNVIYYKLRGNRCVRCFKLIKNQHYHVCYECKHDGLIDMHDGIFIYGYFDQKRHSTPFSSQLYRSKKDPQYHPIIADLLELAYRESGVNVEYFVPVPRRENKEGLYNLPTELARRLSEGTGATFADILYFNRETKEMRLLTKEERFKNMHNAISVRHNVDVSGKVVGLIDDIFTTGATINECARALKEDARAFKVYVFCVGRSVPRYERGYLR